MNTIVLTKSTTPIIGWIAELLGLIMEGIFNLLDLIGIPNIGLSIILFTIVIYLLLLPLTIKQQKFSKLSAKMNPELNAIREKYKNRKDNDSAMQMNAETQAVYAKYGVSPSGSCVQLLIQMPILFALYQVIYKMPAYVGKIGSAFKVLADKIVSTDNAAFLTNPTGLSEEVTNSITKVISMYGQEITKGDVTNGVIDVLNKLSSTDMNAIAAHYGLSDLAYNGELILSNDTTRGLIDTYNNFLGLNMGNSPSFMVNEAIAAGAWLMVVAALLIPALSAITQWINTKLMPQTQSDNGNSNESSMASSMKMMNTFMPIMSAFFCYTLPAGMGLYWIAGSVVRSIQQVIINKQMDKIDLNELIEKNKDKSAKKMAKIDARQKKYAEYAAMNTRNINSNNNSYTKKANDAAQKSANTASAPAKNVSSSSNAKPGSLMARANMVKDYNEKNSKK